MDRNAAGDTYPDCPPDIPMMILGCLPILRRERQPFLGGGSRRYLAERKPAPKQRRTGASVRRFRNQRDLLSRASWRDMSACSRCPPQCPSVFQRTRALPILKVIKRLESRKAEEPYQRRFPKTINDKALTAIGAVLSHAVDNGFIERIRRTRYGVDSAQHDTDMRGLPHPAYVIWATYG